MPLDIPTLFVVSTCITACSDCSCCICGFRTVRVRALGWWAAAYLIGGFAVALWMIGPMLSSAWPEDVAPALLFVCCGMIWSGARKFHDRDVLPLAVFAGAIVWLLASYLPALAVGHSARIVLSSLIIAAYAVLTAIELKRDRRKPQIARVRAIVMPILHGAIFLSPILTMHFLPESGVDDGAGLSKSSFALFALLTLLYVVGTAFIVVVMAKEHAVLLHKTAAVTDPLTGLFNRRGYQEAAQRLIDMQARKGEPVTVLMFDLDHFKSINDRFGHQVGDEALRVFAETASEQHARGRHSRPARRRGILRDPAGRRRHRLRRRRTRARRVRHRGRGDRQHHGARDRQHRRGVRAGERRASRGADRARGRRALSREIERPQPRGGRLGPLRPRTAAPAPALAAGCTSPADRRRCVECVPA